MRTVRVINQSKDTVIAEQAEMAENIWTRFMGLMGRADLPASTGLIIYPNNSIHMFFMRFPLDVLHVHKDGTVLKILHGIKPWRIGPIVGKCHYTVELPAGTAQQTNTSEGDKIALVDKP